MSEMQLNETHSIDPFWAQDYKILFRKDKLDNFFPTKEMPFVEKCNAIMRLSIYLSIALYIATGVYQYLFIMIIMGAFTFYIYKNQKDNLEYYFNSYKDSLENSVTQQVIEKMENPVAPNVENPFMNINLITDDKTKPAAPPSWNDENMQKKIDNKFNYNLYRDVGDLYGKNNSQREYYTMPSTTIPNNQTSFAKWCYGSAPTCKEKSIYCAPQMDAVPFIDQSNTTNFTNVKY